MKLDDLFIDEHHVPEEALRRLPEKEMLERNYRIRRMHQLYVTHTEMPESQHTKPEDVKLDLLLPRLMNLTGLSLPNANHKTSGEGGGPTERL